MHISWLGNTAIKLQAKPLDQDITIIIDPYRPDHGEFPRSLMPDIGLYTRGEEGSITLSGNPFIISGPGEYETKGALVSALTQDDNNTLLRIDVEQLSIGHLGMIKKELTNDELEMLSEVDILFVPVVDFDCLDAEKAAKICNTIEPRIIIPMAFKSDTDPKAQGVELFLKEMGAPKSEPEKKVIIKKKDLPAEETKVIVLAKE